jgi:3-methyladenine DNA glycosylase AlkD
MAQLEKLGTAQNVKIYKRHGSGDNVFGVSFANLNALQKRIKVDHALAEQLWETGNADARSLAILVADAEAVTAAWAEKWLKDIRYYLLADLYGGLVARSRVADAKMKKWMASKKEYVRQAGYVALCHRLKDAADSVPDEFCEQALSTIEVEIHNAPNRARHAMNMALIAIGIYKPALKAKAMAVARRIGKVEVDHGETGCKTPDAKTYIEKAIARKKPK